MGAHECIKNILGKLEPKILLYTPEWGKGVIPSAGPPKEEDISCNGDGSTVLWKLTLQCVIQDPGRKGACNCPVGSSQCPPADSVRCHQPARSSVYPLGLTIHLSLCWCAWAWACSSALQSPESHTSLLGSSPTYNLAAAWLYNWVFSRPPTGFFIWPSTTPYSHPQETIFAFLSAPLLLLSLSWNYLDSAVATLLLCSYCIT